MKTGFLTVHRGRSAVLGWAAALLATVGFVDYATGPEVSLSIFYLFPSVTTAWLLGRRAWIALAVASTGLWLLVELNFGKTYQSWVVPYCNALLQLGMALFSASLTARLKDRERAIVQEIAGRKRAESELRLERLLADAIEKEQQRIGRDLHDGLGQHLVSSGFVASMLRTKLEEKGLPEAAEARELTALIGDAIGQSGRLARGLCPVKLESEGLTSALQELADNVSAHFRVNCRFESNGPGLIADPATSSNLYRIAQEAVNNGLKHGEPKNILVRFNQGKTRVELSVLNDGKKYARPPENHSGMGLRIMERRARLIGGKCHLGPGPAGGTLVHCVVPLGENPAPPPT